ncbi:DRTGG domain-containing protein [Vagococcus elongatus]|uniref:CBS domain-containing protein n=1 Tax=Vagococcus elongatus TaxID=180344 RepID=A0A430B4H9_9ENTE|nr:DRTGG domain-containing protein [Vagococcus elongatus]RSU15161.1 hypothetical protein CBF29_02170 [Vagococcus elongatus]
MSTKHDQILAYVESLPVGERISVRGIAKDLNVSEGTAYRAIKAAENDGLVSTIERVGTIRIEQKNQGTIEKLTFNELVKIIEGTVLGGSEGLDKPLVKFIIGAMTPEAMEPYISSGSLMIVGNRKEVQELALRREAAVLVTGGFSISEETKELADEVKMPVLGTSYDTFTVASLINRAISDQMIRKEILLVGDIYTKLSLTDYLYHTDTVADYEKKSLETGHSRFPVVNKNMRVLGIVTSKDVIGRQAKQGIEKVMTKETNNAKLHMSVASVGHLMIWDGLEMMPVVEDDLTLIGIISRRDVMRAMQMAQRQPQVANTIPDQISESIIEVHPEDKSHFILSVVISPQMVDNIGTLSYGVLSEIITSSVRRMMHTQEKRNIVIEQVSLYYFKVIQIESQIEIVPKILEIGRRSAKLDVEVKLDNTIVAKAIVVCQLMGKS